MSQPVFRFAPSPYGWMHLGNAFSALMNEKLAREASGRLLLRIEDIDLTRTRPEFVQGIFDDMEWLGIEFERPVIQQSGLMATYRAKLQWLQAEGLLYPCSCTRSQLHKSRNGQTDPEGQNLYPQTCRFHGARAGEPVALRLKMDEALARAAGPLSAFQANGAVPNPSVWGDVVLGGKDSGVSYHLCVVMDDGWQGVTHVVRGKDVEAATSIHLLLQRLFDLPHPNYFHHDLIMFDPIRKLSKSHGDQSLKQLRAKGITGKNVRQMLGFD